MLEPRISSESFIGAALMSLGISYYVAATADHSDDWFEGDTHEKLTRRFGILFTRDQNFEGKTIIVVDRNHNQYVVKDIHELERVWRKGQISYALSMSEKTYKQLRGDIAIAVVPVLETA